jgi:hypothetical protein
VWNRNAQTVALLAALVVSASPARAAIPSIAEYFSGTWTCTTAAGAHVMKAYGGSEFGLDFVLYNSYVTADGHVALIVERYSQHGPAVSEISQAVGGSFVYVGTSPGFVGDRLVFNGTLTTLNTTIYQRSTVTRTDASHFSRTFENAATADGPYRLSSSETCLRVAPAPVPTAHAPQ